MGFQDSNTGWGSKPVPKKEIFERFVSENLLARHIQYPVRRAAGMRAHTHNLLLPQPSLFSKAVGFLVVRSSVAEQLALLCRTLEKRRYEERRGGREKDKKIGRRLARSSSLRREESGFWTEALSD